jgi:dephospho-CoA kinase
MPLAPAPPFVIGLLGGIASGKSWVAGALAGKDGLLIDADAIAREVLETEEVRAELRRAFGPEILLPDGRPDRVELARRVFSQPAERARLESFTHPRIRARIRALLEGARARRIPRVVLDVPLLLENQAAHGLAEECHELLFVDSDAQARERRAAASRGWESGEVARREAQQLPLEDKRARAHFVITNRGTLEELETQVLRYLAHLEQRATRLPHG